MREFKFRIGDDPKVFDLCFSTNALKRLQDMIGMPVAEYFSRIVKTEQDGTNRLHMSAVDLQNLLWAGLEGARVRNKALRAGKPFDIYDIGDMVDSIDEDHTGQVWDCAVSERVPLGLFVMTAFLESRERQAQSQIEALREEEAKARAEADEPPIEVTAEQKAEAARLDPTQQASGPA